MSKLITYSYLRSETDISPNVENSKLDNPIKRAQDRLRAIIGPAFYDELVTQVSSTPQSLSTANDAFFDPYVKQFLAWQAYELYFAKSWFHDTPTGPRVFKEDNSEALDQKTIGEMLALAKRDTQFYKEQMINFLRSAQKASTSSYPLFTQSSNEIVSSGFGITAISKEDTVAFKIDSSIINQEP